MRDEKYLRSLCRDAIQRHQRRNRMFAEIENMVNGDWLLPKAVRDVPGVHKVVSTEPHDAVRAATRILSGVDPRITLHPLLSTPENMERTEEIEQVLRWWLRGLNTRRNASVVRDVVRSAVMYDMIAFQTVYLPHERKAKRISEDRAKRLYRKGPFSWRMHNPRTVYPVYGSDDLEAVIVGKVMKAYEVESEWGIPASEFVQGTHPPGTMATSTSEGSGAHTPEFQNVGVFDYWDDTYRYVWAVPMNLQTQIEMVQHEGFTLMAKQEHGLGFLPWVVMSGGTNLEFSSDNMYLPLLYILEKTGSWDTKNISDTLMITEAIRNFRAPTRVETGPAPEQNIYETNDQVDNTLVVRPGHDAKPFPKPQLDANLAQVGAALAERMQRSTVPATLQGAAGDVNFAAANLQTKVGLSALKPYKELAEQAISAGLEQMLQWLAYQETEPVYSYGWTQEGEMNPDGLAIDPQEIEPDAIYIDVALHDDAPLDMLQQANAANMARGFGLSKRQALTQYGVTDADAILEESEREAVREVLVQIEIEKLQMRAQMEMQQMMQEAQAQQAQAQGPPPGQQAGMNPGLGGLSPYEAGPDFTREQISGQDAAGLPI